MSFGQPLWFAAFAVIPVFIFLFIRSEQQRAVLLRRMVAARLTPKLAGTVSIFLRRLRFAIVMLGLALIIVSMARPRWGYAWETRKSKGRDVIIAIDVSRSMLANDVSPSRLARAKLAAQDLISQLPGDRIGLIAFAGTSFLQAPLTADHGAVLSALQEVSPDIIPRGGTDIAEAIRSAVDAFGKGESDNRALVLFTDGEELEESATAVAAEQKNNVRIFTVGMGTASGSLISVRDEYGQSQFVKDANGDIVKSRLDEARLREIAQATNGFYVHLTSGPAEMQQIVRDGLQPMAEHDLDSQYSRKAIERYQWPLSAGMLLLCASLLIGERKRGKTLRPAVAAATALLLAAALFPQSASAKNDGVEAYEQKDYKGATDSFTKQLDKHPKSDVLQFDLGSAAYKTGDYDRALEKFSSALTSPDPNLREKAEYNLGNTLFQRGVNLQEKPAKIQELKNALQHYDAALKSQPSDADAQYNREVVRKLLEELQKEEKQQQQQNKDQQQKDQKNKDQQKDQNQQQKQQNQQSKDQKDQQGQQNQPQQGQQQQQQGGQSKDQQNQQQQQGQKDGQQGQQSQSGKEGEQGQQQSQQPQQKDGQQGEQKQPSQNADSKSGQQKQQQQQSGKEGEQAKNEPKDQSQQPGQEQQPARKLSGDVKDAGKPQKPGEKGEPQNAEQQAAADAAAEAAAAAEGHMTEKQARNLLESLKSEDDRVHLLNPKGRKDASPPGSYRDW